MNEMITSIIIIILPLLYFILDVFKLFEIGNKLLFKILIILGTVVFGVFNLIKAIQDKRIETTNVGNLLKSVELMEVIEDKVQLLDNLTDKIDSTFITTNKNIVLIDSLNQGLEGISSEVRENITEYRHLNNNYQNAIKLEKQKIEQDKPLIQIIPQIITDSTSINYNYSVYNTGQRMADSIILIDALYCFDTINNKIFTNRVSTSRLISREIESLPGNSNMVNTISSIDPIDIEIFRSSHLNEYSGV